MNGRKNAELFLTFFKIGAFSFGGGAAMIPLIRREVSEKHGWISDEDLLDITAIAESTPGPIAVNAATFIGWKVSGFAGALCATFGVVLPSFVIIFIISHILRQFENVRAVKYAFAGVRAGVLALVLQALLIMYRQCRKGVFEYILMGFALIATAFFDMNVIAVILICAALGLVSVLLNRKECRRN